MLVTDRQNIETLGCRSSLRLFRGGAGALVESRADNLMCKVCLSCRGLAGLNKGELVEPDNWIFYKKNVSSGDYQQTKGRRSEKQIPTGKLFGLRKHDYIKTSKGCGYVKGKRGSGYFALGNIHGKTIHASVNVNKDVVRIAARSTTLTYGAAIPPHPSATTMDGVSLPNI